MGGFGWGMGLLPMLVFWGAIIVIVILAARWLLGRGDSAPTRTPLDILKERYARGEIGKDEFEQRKRDLQA